ncbi:single-stranded DNA exonuclease [Sulfuricella sp. T08]|uniref:single-stranded-DNA-specific exonuclease RecJ n=1 Tax=Sulfuricella sp. T08 TaxID=1632857 RepID=UPI000617A170|nr:single-stranded-DNA-specific exonuclease RecJ [Sulfuricella sp. T08]GAO35568.1 single-stranded DNA exonuclease [Sulfuricella sp. T08]
MPSIVPRPYSQADAQRLSASGLHPVLARIYAARGISETRQIEHELVTLLPFTEMKGATEMARRLADAIQAEKRLLIIADYDSDGATACTVAMRALREFGAIVDYLVPNRFEFGYGLTPEIVQLAAKRRPDILITVDNGISSVSGVDEARKLGIEVLITDHHLPGEELPDAAGIVNPNQPGCNFPSKNLAGVGVIFYMMLALRAELRQRGTFNSKPEPNLARLLDLVALGTVADVVKLDDNNRILVHQGLKRIRAGRASAGIAALLQVAGRKPERASTYDLGFVAGPRLNAAGRLDDMALGIECLLTDNLDQATKLAQQLDALNRERRAIEADMLESAETITQDLSLDSQDSFSLCLHDRDWHQGVIGILASRLKDKFHRPVIAFAEGHEGELKGSGRSIPGLHLRDALDLVSKREPTLIKKFGGHAMAAGLTIDSAHLPRFRDCFEAVCSELLTPALLTRIIETDGALNAAEASLELAQLMRTEVWGQAFPDPSFQGEFRVAQQRVVGEKHLKLRLAQDGRSFEAMLFFHADPLPDRVLAVYRLDVNEYNGNTSLQLLLSHWEPA